MRESNITLLNALNTYKIFVQMESTHIPKETLEKIINHIETYEDYINNGGEISDSWLKDNHTILSKAVKCTHRHLKVTSADCPELEQLNKFMVYYRIFYSRCGFDFDILPILP